jgi:DNA-binding NtrC family response regulator
MRRNLERLKEHSWPGNVRELKNVVQRAFILASDDIGVDALPLGVVEEQLGTNRTVRVGTPIEEAEQGEEGHRGPGVLPRESAALAPQTRLSRPRKPCCIDPG